jgi:flagellar motor switch protein FliM
MACDERIIQGMLQAAQDRAAPELMGPDAVDYDWSVPHRFGPQAHATVESLGTDIAGRLSRRLRAYLRLEEGLEMVGVTEKYARDLVLPPEEGEEREKVAFIGLTDSSGREQGLIRLPLTQASAWVSRLLGGSSDVEEERELSSLEVSLLEDVLHSVGAEISGALADSGGTSLTCSGDVRTDVEGLDWDETLELCEFPFRPEGSEDPPTLSVFLLADSLAVSQQDSGGDAQMTPEQTQQALVHHFIQGAETTVRARTGGGLASMRDIAALEIGDVLVLETRAQDPIELLARDALVAIGFPVVCEGCYAIQIAELAPGDPAQGAG